MPEAVEDLDGLGGIEYPLGGTCVLFGVVLMVLLEHAAHIMHAPHHGSGSGGDTPVRDTADSSMPCAPAGAVAVPPICSSSPAKAAQHDDGGVPADLEADVGHRHVCVSRGSASNWLSAANAAELEGGLRLRVLAYMFELGCIAHSVIIGVGLGINKTDRSEVTALLIALSFHQWLEGISLASVIVRGGVSLLHGLAMVLAYSLTCPVGIAIGIAIASSYDEESDKTRGLQGTFNGVSSGMLLYIALVQLLAEDMGRFTPGRANAAIRLGCFAALCCGAACMCLLAVWA